MNGPYQQPGYPQQPGGYPGQWTPPPPRRNNTALIIGVIVGVLILIGGIITVVVVTNNHNTATALPPTSATTGTATSTSSSYPNVTTPTPRPTSSELSIGQCLGTNSSQQVIYATCGTGSSTYMVVQKVALSQSCGEGYGAFTGPNIKYCLSLDDKLDVGTCFNAQGWKSSCGNSGEKILLIVPGPHQTGACHPEGSTATPDKWKYLGAPPSKVACLGPQ